VGCLLGFALFGFENHRVESVLYKYEFVDPVELHESISSLLYITKQLSNYKKIQKARVGCLLDFALSGSESRKVTEIDQNLQLWT
jgi:hypothetical protein